MSVIIKRKSLAAMNQPASFSSALRSFILESRWPDSIKNSCFLFLESYPDHAHKLSLLFDNPDLLSTCIPVLVFHEEKDGFLVLYIDVTQEPPEPGEPKSLLSYFRAYGYDDTILNSDCYGQLSCSSCSIEILNGLPKNPTPREEEFDMLDIDTDKPGTPFSRLSCQTIVGDSPLIITIRKYRSAFR